MIFFDPTHKVHNTISGKCWQPKGGENTVVLPSNTGRDRLTVLGALDILKQKLVSIVTEKNCDQVMTQKAYEKLRKAYPDGKEIVLIEDNARYNRAYATQDRAKELNITPKFLPPYCPNLNLIERVWKFMKKVMKNIFYPTFTDFKMAVTNFCKNFRKHKTEIKKLISQKFQIIKAV